MKSVQTSWGAIVLASACAGALLIPADAGGQQGKREERKRPNGNLSAIFRVPGGSSPGGIAGLVNPPICFEAAEGYVVGELNVDPMTGDGQQGWIATPVQPVIDTVNPPQGAQNLRFSLDPGSPAGTALFCISPGNPPQPPGQYTVSVNVNIGDDGGADYDVIPQCPSQPAGFSAQVNFSFLGNVRVVDGGVFVDTGVDWMPGFDHLLQILVRGDAGSGAGTREYFLDGVRIHVGSGAGLATAVESVAFLSDNFNLAESGDFDCLNVVYRPCISDLTGDGVTGVVDLLDLIGDWGPCSGICYSDLTRDGTTGVLDLLALIGGWGPCVPPSGACCTDGACAVQTFDACLAGGGTYQGNGVDCDDVECPQIVPNDFIANAIDITGNINGAAVTGDNTLATPAQDDGMAGDPEIPAAGSPSCQWEMTPTDTHNTVWYTFTAPDNGSVTIHTCASVAPFQDSILALFLGATEVGCSEDVTGCGTFMSRIVTTTLTPGQVYHLLLANPGGWGGSDPGPFTLTITSPP